MAFVYFSLNFFLFLAIVKVCLIEEMGFGVD